MRLISRKWQVHDLTLSAPRQSQHRLRQYVRSEQHTSIERMTELNLPQQAQVALDVSNRPWLLAYKE